VNTSGTVPLVSGTGTGDISFLNAGSTPAITVGTNSQTFTFAGNFNVSIASVTKVNGNKTWTNTLTSGKTLTFGALNLNATTQNNQFIVDGTGATAITGSITELTIPGILVKNGTGTLTVSGSNSYSGTTTISAGVLNIQSINALGTATGNTTVATNSALQIQGGIQFAAEPLSLAGSGVNTDGALRSISGNNTWSGAITQTAASRIQADQDTLTISGGISGAFDLNISGTGNVIVSTLPISIGAKAFTKGGTGTVTLNTANTYSGATTVNAGTLVQGNAGAFGTSNSFTVTSGAFLNASLAGITVTGATGLLNAGRTSGTGTDIAGNISVANGATFKVGGGNTAATASILGNLTLDGSVSPITLQFALGSNNTVGGGVNGLVALTGNLTLSGTNNVTLTTLNGPLASGNYTLFTYTGSLAGSGSFAAPTGLPSGRSVYSYDTTSTPGSVFLVVAGQAANLTWVGGLNGNAWDVQTTVNFTGAADSSFYNGDAVAFTDSGAANNTVNVGGTSGSTVQPLSLTVNSTANYTFAGAGSIGGTTGLTKQGTGTLTIQTANTYTGATSINAGIVNVQNAAALGASTSTATVTSGATLQLQGGITGGANPLVLNGTGVSGGGALVNVSGNNSWAGTINVASATLIQSNLNNLSLNGAFTGSGALTLTGPGTITFGGTAGSGFTGSTTITTGTTVSASLAGALPTGTDITVAGTLDLNGTSQAIKSLSGSGNVTLGSNSSTVLSVNLGLTTFSGVISGTGGLSRLSSGNAAGLGLTLTNKNTYSGTTNIQNNNATLRIGITDALPTGTTLTFLGTTNTNTIFDLNGFNQTIAAITSATTTGSVFVQNNSGSGTSVLTITNGTGSFTATTGTARIRDNDGVATGGLVALTITGGTTTFGSTNTYSGNTTITGGTLTAGIANAFSPTSALTLGTGTTLNAAGFSQAIGSLAGTGSVTLGTTAGTVLSINGGVTTFGGVISGTGGISRLATGTTADQVLTFTVQQSYTGSTNIQNAGAAIRLGLDNALPPTTTLTFAGTTNGSATNAPVYLDLNGKNQSIVALNSATTTGRVFIENDSGAGTSVLTITNGTGTFTATSGQASIRDNNGTTTGGIVAVTITGGTTTFVKAQAYSGVTTISGGALKAGGAGIIANSTSVNAGAAGTFDLNGFSQTVIDLQGAGTVTSAAAATLTVTTANFSGAITGATSFAKANAGTAILTGNNTYTGTTTITGGTLNVNGQTGTNSGTGTGAVTVGTATANSGTLTGNGQIGSQLTVNSGGTLSPGIGTFTVGTDPAAAATVTLNGSYVLSFDTTGHSSLNIVGNSSSVLNFSSTTQIRLNSTSAFNQSWDNSQPTSWVLGTVPAGTTVNGLGSVAFDTTNFTPGTDVSALSLTTNGNQLVLNFTPVPEPMGIIGIISAGFGLIALRRRGKVVS
jgi:autotransporter-associated beta strand protein